MDTPQKLAAALEALTALQARGVTAIRSRDLSRTHRERLLKTGFLKEVIKGWYIMSRPDEAAGESTAWYTSFWGFCAQYLNNRFDEAWSLSPEQSLRLHAGDTSVPAQLLVRAPRAGNQKTDFPHHTSIFETRAIIAQGDSLTMRDGLRLFTIEEALIRVQESFFTQNPTEARTILAIMPDPSPLLARLLEGGHTRAAGRLAGGFRSIGKPRIADDLIAAMKAAGHDVRENDPFSQTLPLPSDLRSTSPHVHRIRLQWNALRATVIAHFPKAKPMANDVDAYLGAMDDLYVTDAYHSLSIEGYQVSPQLIEKVRTGGWNPSGDENDRAMRNALAARGYWEAFQSVRESVRAVLEGADPAQVAEQDLTRWYRALFTPSVAAGLVQAAQLAGYRNGPVYIRASQHVPMNVAAVRDCMPVFFGLLAEETDPAARVVLGHFMFVYIHPFSDGNGRTARFLMNLMLAAAGHPWTVIKVENRAAYMASLEAASVQGDIEPFTRFLAQAVRDASPG